MSRFPKARRLVTEEFFLKPYGDRTTDTTNLYNLINRLDANKQNVVVLGEGTHKWDGTVATSLVGYAGLQCNKPLFIRGHKGLGSVIETSNNFTLNFGSFAHPTDTDNPATMSAIAAGGNTFTSPSASIAAGDWVLIWSDDEVPNVSPHLDIQYPAELHRVARIKDVSGTDTYVLSDPVRDAFTTRPKIEVVPLTRGVGVADVRLQSTDQPANTAWTSFQFQRCLSPRVERLFTEESGCGDLQFNYCADVQVNDFSGLQQGANSNDVYGVVAGTCNGVLFQDSTWHETRHLFTTFGAKRTAASWAVGQTILSINVWRTSAGKLYRATTTGTTGATAPTHTSGTASDGGVAWQYVCNTSSSEGIRFGGPLNAVVKNVTGYCGTSDQDEGMVIFDTHPEGHGVLFDTCRTFSGGVSGIVTYGFSSRSRHTELRRCEVHAKENGAVYGFYSSGYGSSVRDSLFRNTWYGVRAQARDALSCRGSEFVDNFGNAFRIQAGNDHEFDGNVVSGGCAQASTDETFIKVIAGTGHKIMRNQLYKGTNTWSVSVDQAPSGTWRDHVDFRHNYVEGYGSGAIGSDTGTTPGASMETEYASHNFTDA